MLSRNAREPQSIEPAGAREMAGSGFRDFTRIAHSDPELWADIVVSNRKAVAAPLQAVASSLEALARALEADDAEAVERIVAAGRAALGSGSVRSPEAPDNTNPRPWEAEHTARSLM